MKGVDMEAMQECVDRLEVLDPGGYWVRFDRRGLQSLDDILNFAATALDDLQRRGLGNRHTTEDRNECLRMSGQIRRLLRGK